MIGSSDMSIIETIRNIIFRPAPAPARKFVVVELLRYDADAFDCIHVETAVGKDATNFIDRELHTTANAVEAERLARHCSVFGGYYGVVHNGVLMSLYFEGKCKNITYIP